MGDVVPIARPAASRLPSTPSGEKNGEGTGIPVLVMN